MAENNKRQETKVKDTNKAFYEEDGRPFPTKTGAYNPTQNKKVQFEQETNIPDDYFTSNKQPFNFGIDADDSDDNKIIIYNLPESENFEDDIIKVKHLLLALDIIDIRDITVCRRGFKKDDGTVRAVQVILPSVTVVNKILKKLDEKSKIPNTNIRIVKFDANFNKKKMEQL